MDRGVVSRPFGFDHGLQRKFHGSVQGAGGEGGVVEVPIPLPEKATHMYRSRHRNHRTGTAYSPWVVQGTGEVDVSLVHRSFDARTHSWGRCRIQPCKTLVPMERVFPATGRVRQGDLGPFSECLVG